MKTIFIDTETTSDVDLVKDGLDAYVHSKGFQVLVVSYKINDEPVKSLVYPWASEDEQAFLDEISRADYLVAHNAAFDIRVLNTQFGIDLENTNTVIDTMTMALYLGYKKVSLAHLAYDLKLDQKKQEAGKDLIKLFSKCGLSEIISEISAHPDEYKAFQGYCESDVKVLEALHKALQHRLLWMLKGKISLENSRIEHELMKLTRTANAKGVMIDRELAQRVLDQVNKLREESPQSEVNINSTPQLRVWFENHGYPMQSFSAPARVVALQDPRLKGEAREFLEFIENTKNSSFAKLPVLLKASERDGVVRDFMRYFGAPTTGRFAANNPLQVQNLPHASTDDYEGLDKSVENVKSCKDLLPLLRKCVIARPGNEFFIADYSQIEARIAAVYSGNEEMVKAFEDGKDPYKTMASLMYSKPYDEITKEERSQGKVAVLAAGYGISGNGLSMHPGNSLNKAEATALVNRFRASNPGLTKAWAELHSAAMRSLRTKEVIDVLGGKVRVSSDGTDVFLELPSDRAVVLKDASFNPDDGGLYCNGSDKAFHLGGLFGLVCQSTARDIMAQAMVSLSHQGFPAAFTVHDEVVLEVPKGREVPLDCLLSIPWFPFVKLEVDVMRSDFYRK